MANLTPGYRRSEPLSMGPARWRRSTWSAVALVLLGLCLLASARPAHADAPSFADRLKYGSGSDPIKAVAFGDMNGDGSLDLVVGNDERGVGAEDLGGNGGGELSHRVL